LAIFNLILKAIEEAVKEGKVRSIGLANFNVTQLQDVLKNCKIKPAVVQIEVHPYLQNDKIIEFCKKNDIAVKAFSPLGSCEIAQ
jgi:diketogulonate reductase-like aldo/keto reductase